MNQKICIYETARFKQINNPNPSKARYEIQLWGRIDADPNRGEKFRIDTRKGINPNALERIIWQKLEEKGFQVSEILEVID